MAATKSRVCPLCGKTVDVRGFALHLLHAHGMKDKAERDAVMAKADQPSPDEQAHTLIDELLAVRARLETLWSLRSIVPEPALDAVEDSARRRFLEILDDLESLYGVDPEDEEYGEDWRTMAGAYLCRRQNEAEYLAKVQMHTASLGHDRIIRAFRGDEGGDPE